MLKNNLKDFFKISHINEELIKYSGNKIIFYIFLGNTKGNNDAKILKKIDDLTDFLHKSFADLNRIHKNEISIKTELTIDSLDIKPININTKNLTAVIDKINPKDICFDNSYQPDKIIIKRNRDEETDNISYNKNSFKMKKLSSQDESISKINLKGNLYKNNTFSRNDSNASYSVDERKRLESAKVPKPRKVVQERNRYRSGEKMQKNEENGSEIEKTVTDEGSLNMQKLPFIKMQKNEKIKKNDEILEIPVIFSIGDMKYVLKYFLDDNFWQIIEFDEKNSIFKPNVRYASLCNIPGQKLILTGKF